MHWITETPARDDHPGELSHVSKVTFGYLFNEAMLCGAWTGVMESYGHVGGYVWMRVVAFEVEVVDGVVEQVVGLAPDHQPGQGARRAGELGAGLLDMIQVKMDIAAEPYDLPWSIAALLREQVCEQGKVGDVPAQPQIGIR